MGTRRFKALIVEDNDTDRATLKNLLSQRFPDMQFEETKNGEETLAIINYFNPDIIFMDVVLPGQNGFEVPQKVRASGYDVVIIIMSSYDMPAYREAAKKYGGLFCFKGDFLRLRDHSLGRRHDFGALLLKRSLKTA